MFKILLPFLMLGLKNDRESAAKITYKVDPAVSSVEWLASKVTGKHNGTVPISGGTMVVDGTKLLSGSFEANMAALTVDDLTGSSKEKLTGHLKSDDFFSTTKFPKAKFVLTSAKQVEGGNYQINGTLEIKGIKQPVSFMAGVVSQGDKILGSASFNVDRTRYDIKYRSANWFTDLGDKAIYDDFTLTVKLVLVKS